MKAIVSGMATRIRKGARVHVYIKEWMEHLGVSDETMAGRLNLASRSSVWKLYKEQHRLDMGRIQQIADALGISWRSLFYPPQVQSIDAILDGIPEDRRNMAVDIVRRVIGAN